LTCGRTGEDRPTGWRSWCSYLFDGPGTHFNDIFEAESGETRQYWSMPYVPGSRYLDKPVYLLTSHETFSGGEDFCYTLQALGRAKLIGETTGGGAHPTGMRPLSPTMAISVPFARSVNPVTGTNWEGTGVVPDVPAAAAEACDVAYGMALRHVLSLDPPPPILQEASAAIARLTA
jgi:Peptidase family S41